MRSLRTQRVTTEWLLKTNVILHTKCHAVAITFWEKPFHGLLAFSIADKSEDLMEIIEIKACIENVVSSLEEIISQKNIVLSVEDLPLSVKCVPIKIQQLFQNLISNAIKFQTPNNCPEIKIYGRLNEGSHVQEIIIEDNGIGFPQDQADEIFEPFHRLHNESKYEGSGIGLATAKKIVNFHGWTIRAESEEAKGSKFIISMPLVESQLTPEFSTAN